MILAIDVGNHRIKWGVYDQTWLQQGVLEHHALAEIAAVIQGLPAPRQAVVSSVADTQLNTALRTLLNQFGMKVHWVKSQAQFNGLRNGYTHPAQLGSDRWAALVAAWHMKRSACVVAMAGTALTVDALASTGEFVGGLIIPGLAMMQQALITHTAGISSVNGSYTDFPLSTDDAIYSGALSAMTGAIKQMSAGLQQQEQTPPWLLLAGGDATILQKTLSGAGEIVDNLVLEGLVLIAAGPDR